MERPVPVSNETSFDCVERTEGPASPLPIRGSVEMLGRSKSGLEVSELSGIAQDEAEVIRPS